MTTNAYKTAEHWVTTLGAMRADVHGRLAVELVQEIALGAVIEAYLTAATGNTSRLPPPAEERNSHDAELSRDLFRLMVDA